jgi:hypothetical protein
MASIIKNLPDDIKRAITAYTYVPQSDELLGDIRHYSMTRVKMCQLLDDIFKNSGAWGCSLAKNVFSKCWKSYTIEKRNHIATKLTVIRELRHPTMEIYKLLL